MLNKLTFESEGLTVDYVTFNFEQLNESQKTNLINYFSILFQILMSYQWYKFEHTESFFRLQFLKFDYLRKTPI